MYKLIEALESKNISNDEFINNPFVIKLGLNKDSIRNILQHNKTELNKKIMSYWLPLNVTI